MSNVTSLTSTETEHFKPRFEKKINKTESCWLWTGCTRKGYGAFQVRPHVLRGAHRVSYSLYVGELKDEMFVCHRCDNPLCVNPEHLFLGTPLDNMRDMASKGRRVITPGIKGEANLSAKLNENQVRLIFVDARPSRLIAKEYGIGKTVVNNIKNKTKWGHLWGK